MIIWLDITTPVPVQTVTDVDAAPPGAAPQNTIEVTFPTTCYAEIVNTLLASAVNLAAGNRFRDPNGNPVPMFVKITFR